MGCLMNILWLLFGGILTAVEYLISSLLLMITIVGIPFGMQTLKMASLALWPFGKEVRSGSRSVCADECVVDFAGRYLDLCVSPRVWGDSLHYNHWYTFRFAALQAGLGGFDAFWKGYSADLLNNGIGWSVK